MLCPPELELEYYYQNASIADATIHIPLGNTVSKQHLHRWASWLDLASVLLYLVVVVFISLYQQKVSEEVASKTVTVVDYSVQVWDLPKVGPFSCPTTACMPVGSYIILLLGLHHVGMPAERRGMTKTRLISIQNMLKDECACMHCVAHCHDFLALAHQ